MSYLMIAEYLNEEESGTLREKLDAAGLKPIVKRHGLPRMFGLDINYRVFVDRADAGKALPLVDAFQKECAEKREKTKTLMQTQCPTCTSTGIRHYEKTSIIDRIRYAGVMVWECKGCGGRWFT
jgi:hypothetical protein